MEKKNEIHKAHNHLKMMALCCGIPIVLGIGISHVGFKSEFTDNLLFLLCPLMMGGMMLINRKKDSNSCCQPQNGKVGLKKEESLQK